MRIKFLVLFLIIVQYNFSQCDEYYINELISGSDEDCYFPEGSPVRFCPNLNGVSINGFALDAIRWEGIFTQYITLSKNRGIAGNLILKLKEKEIIVDLYGCGGKRKYSISFTKDEYNNYKKKKEYQRKLEKKKKELLISNIENKVSNGEYILAAELYIQNKLSIDSLHDKIQSGIINIEYDYENIEIIELLKELYEQYRLNFDHTDYQIISELKSGLSIYNVQTNETTNLDSKPFVKEVNGFNRYCNFKYSFKISTEKGVTGVKLSMDFESQMEHPSYGRLNFFYVIDKKGQEKLLYGYDQVGKPSSKKYPTVIELKSQSFSNEFSGRNGKVIYTKSVMVNGFHFIDEKSLGEELLKIKVFL